MNDEEALLNSDAVRRRAMISADAQLLAESLSDDLVWTHSSGKTDNKAAILGAIERRSVRYVSLEVEDYAISSHGDTFIYHGLLTGQVVKDGVEKRLRNKFLSVWRRVGSSFEMLAWQSTGV